MPEDLANDLILAGILPQKIPGREVPREVYVELDANLPGNRFGYPCRGRLCRPRLIATARKEERIVTGVLVRPGGVTVSFQDDVIPSQSAPLMSNNSGLVPFPAEKN